MTGRTCFLPFAALAAILALPGCATSRVTLLGPQGQPIAELEHRPGFRRDAVSLEAVGPGGERLKLCVLDEAVSGNVVVMAGLVGAAAGAPAGPIGVGAGAGTGLIVGAAQELLSKPPPTPLEQLPPCFGPLSEPGPPPPPHLLPASTQPAASQEDPP